MLWSAFICSIAGYDDPSTCNVLDVTTRPPQVNPKYRKLTIIAGQDERLHDEGGGDRDIVPAATTYQELEDEITDDEDAAITEITKRGLDYPGLVQIINDRGCDALGPAGKSSVQCSVRALNLDQTVD